MGIATQKENLDANDTLYDLFALVKKTGGTLGLPE
jgi:hypothetical protein